MVRMTAWDGLRSRWHAMPRWKWPLAIVVVLYLIGPTPHLEWSVGKPAGWQCPPGMSLRGTPSPPGYRAAESGRPSWMAPQGSPEIPVCNVDNTTAQGAESYSRYAAATRPVADHRHISLYLSALSIRLFELDFTSGHHAGFGIGVRRPSGPAR